MTFPVRDLDAERARLLATAGGVGLGCDRRDVPGPVLGRRRDDLRFTWADQCADDPDVFPLRSAIATSIAEAFDVSTGERVGYVKVSFTTPELAAACYPTLLHFAGRNWCLDFDDRAKLWFRAHHYAGVQPASMSDTLRSVWSLSAADAPSDGQISSDLDALCDRLGTRAEFDAWVASMVVPFVAFARVSEPRRGVATTLYEVAARCLAERGLPLRASGLQSSEAEALWASFESGPLPLTTVRLNLKDGPRDYRALDLRP